MNTALLVIVLLFSNGDAYIDVSRPMDSKACEVLAAEIMMGQDEDFLMTLTDGEGYRLKWAVCREMKQ